MFYRSCWVQYFKLRLLVTVLRISIDGATLPIIDTDSVMYSPAIRLHSFVDGIGYCIMEPLPVLVWLSKPTP